MNTGEFLIKLSWCFIFFYIIKHTFKILEYVIKQYKLRETIENIKGD